MSLLIVSIVALGFGPLLYQFAARLHAAVRLLDGVVMLSVGALVLFVILPHSVQDLGWRAYLLLILGVLGPSLVEHSLTRLQHRAHRAVLVLVTFGVGLHAFADGMALALPGGPVEHGVHLLPVAVVVHRFPAGLVIWWLLRPTYGAKVALFSLVGIGLATIAGYGAEALVAPWLESSASAAFQAFVAGTLLHVAVHRWELHPEG
jgi:zinc transporter ZupT